MSETITRVRYRWGLVDQGSDVEVLPQLDQTADELAHDLLELIAQERVLELAGTRGDRSLGVPIEVDDLCIDTTVRQVRIRVFNRGAHMITGDDEELTRIHRVCCALQRLLPANGRVQAQALLRR